EHDERRLPRAQLVAQRGEDRLRLVAADDEFLQRLPRLGGDVEERAQGSRRVQAVARAPEQAHAVGALGAEPLNERRLADSGLAGNEHEPTGAGANVGQGLLERGLERSALEKFLFGCDGHCSQSCASVSPVASRKQVSVAGRVYLPEPGAIRTLRRGSRWLHS